MMAMSTVFTGHFKYSVDAEIKSQEYIGALLYSTLKFYYNNWINKSKMFYDPAIKSNHWTYTIN